ncbi:MAG: type II toxin-antitoxin system VapC family toxin [Actinomycetota bacterium]|nr:type II toxin-antitoxin system VapC family toxin [Actinomycetota bacterium]
MVGPLVVDASALIDYLIEGSPSSSVSEYLRASELHVPEVCDLEVVSALRRAALRRSATAQAISLLLLDYVDLPIERHRHLSLVGRCWELRENFTATDSSYVALAERVGAPVLTTDRRLARAIRTYTSVAALP